MATRPAKPSIEALVAKALAEGRATYGDLDVPKARLVERLVRTLAEHDVPDAAIGRLRGGDLCLACACVEGDKRAIAVLEDRYGADVQRAYSRLRSSRLSYDDFRQGVRQKLFAPPAPKIAEYGGLGDLRAWLRIVSTRTALDMLRALRRVEQPASSNAILAVPAPNDDPDLAYLKRLYGKEVAVAVEKAAADLRPEERNVLREHYAQGLTIDQIGAVHGIHRATAARRVQRARDALLERARGLLAERLGVSDAEIDSIMRLVQSEIQISVQRVFAES